MKIILGSQSPRRKEILSSLIDKFEIINPDADESVINGESPAVYSERIASDKAMSICSSFKSPENALIITCDTIVCIDDVILGKPNDYTEAYSFLKKLSGSTHTVLSSLHFLETFGGTINNTSTGTEKTQVTFYDLSDEVIEKYLSITSFMDKAGAYAVQENSHLIIKKIEGSITNVIGFPLRLFFRLLNDLNLSEMFINNKYTS